MKIQILKSETADTRTASGLVSKEKLLESSIQHIGDVQRAIAWMIGNLSGVAMRHDWTKVDFINEFHKDFRRCQEDKSIDFRTLPWFKRHVESERHHVNDRCPDDVDLFDLLERIADCVMAGKARSGKVFSETLDPAILVKAYENTMKLLIDAVEVVE